MAIDSPRRRKKLAIIQSKEIRSQERIVSK
jgi:hypothetical protein